MSSREWTASFPEDDPVYCFFLAVQRLVLEKKQKLALELAAAKLESDKEVSVE